MDAEQFARVFQRQKEVKDEAVRVTKYRKAIPTKDKKARFPGFHQRIVDYHAGQEVDPGALKLSCDIVLHESVPTALEDGTKLHSDIFLPARFRNLSDTSVPEAKRVPAIVAWSPYGKQKGTTLLDDFPMRAGVPQDWVSNLQKWEGPDPAFWCAHDYAVVNVDTRGAYTGEGDLLIMGGQEAEDGAAFITWVSEQPWCNGKVALSGNSWLAICQWRIAARRPKGLAAISPWEGLSDFYRDCMSIGGVQNSGFHDHIISTLSSDGKLEDVTAYLKEHPLWDAYWEDKQAQAAAINVPTYAVACWTSPIHTMGTFRSWKLIPDNVPKWLRVHNSMEWPDYYEQANVQDLKRFYDHYLKNITDNGWTDTPKVRVCVLNFGLTTQLDTVNRAEADWPIPRTKYTKYFLKSDEMTLSPDESALAVKGSEVKYDAKTGKSVFRFVMPSAIETTGYPMAHLAMSCDGHDNMDVFVQIEKFSPTGHRQGTMRSKPKNPLIMRLFRFVHDWQVGVNRFSFLFDWGPEGQLRASRALDKAPESISPAHPGYLHTKDTLLRPGEVRMLDVPLAPYGMFWQKGDILQFTVSGKPVLPFMVPGMPPVPTVNSGTHIIHCEGKGAESSYLLLPLV